MAKAKEYAKAEEEQVEPAAEEEEVKEGSKEEDEAKETEAKAEVKDGEETKADDEPKVEEVDTAGVEERAVRRARAERLLTAMGEA